jgi:alkylated DNA repair dioxygenase AlkB
MQVRGVARYSRATAQAWSDITAEKQPPNLCLINIYGDEARLGLHQDRGESPSAVVA